MTVDSNRDREMAREWLSDGHGDCYRYEPREDEAGRTVDSLAALIARAREEERERCAKLIHDALSPDCLAEDHEFCDAYGCGRFKAIIAALRESREPTKSGGRE